LGAIQRELGDELEAAVLDVVRDQQFVGGQRIADFEQAFAHWLGAGEAIGMANGTDALELALRALSLSPGAEVIVPANTFIAAAEAVVLAGATPVFADVSPDTMLLTPAHVAAALTYRTAAVIVVHLYGQMPDMDALSSAARHAGLALIEDAAQAPGASWRGRRAGSAGQAGCFSFGPAGNLGAFGDAGAVVTADDNLARRLRSLRDHGCSRHSRHDHERVGFNSRLDALQAVVLTAKLPRLDAWTAARQSIAARYRAAFGDGPASLVAEEPGSQGAYHLAVALVSDRAGFRRHLAAAGIETQVHYPIPCHWQVPYRHFAPRPLPVAERSAGQVVSLPMFPHMSDDDVAQVCEAICDALGTREFFSSHLKFRLLMPQNSSA
jgi:dTDP-4-amino-4,6-dideoxygalactose transaminase